MPLVEFAYNDQVHPATKVSPFYADMGCHPYQGIEPLQKSNNPTAQEFAERMKKIQEETKAALKKAAEDMSHYYDKKCKDSIEYNEGDQVWLEGVNVKSDQP